MRDRNADVLRGGALEPGACVALENAQAKAAVTWTASFTAPLARDIEKALAKYIRDPVVTVIVTNFVGPSSEQIRVIGEASKPQILAYRRDMTILDVMIAVGGLTDFADGNHGKISRAAEGGKLYSVRLQDLVKRGDISANVDMRPGDIVVIPQSWF